MLVNVSGVIDVGLGEKCGGHEIIVMIEKDDEEVKHKIKKYLEIFPYTTKVSGRFKVLRK